ncbi:MAG TPA: PQQ-dependent sugar dehydrogenase [Candidatus Dormibacteraeota bacterium]
MTLRRLGGLGCLIVLAGCGGGASSSSSVTALLTPTGTAGTTTTATTSATASQAPTAAPTPSPTPAATAAATPTCTVAAQSPPQGTISANYPTALAFAPDGRLFWTERGGTVRVWQGGAARAFASVSTVTTEPGGGYSERGLLGLAISPTFNQDRFVYAFYSDADYTHQHVIRWRDCGGTGTGGTVLITLPSGADCCHKGGRLAFGPDGKLYVTLGEEHTASAAQNTGDVRGKVLRYNPDGSLPADNPFGAANPVWAYGLRNPFGIAIASSGQIAVTNNGPSGDAGSPGTGYDTVIVSLTRGGAYQWPNCYGYSHPIGGASCAGEIAPDWSSEASTVVPTGATFVDASGPAAYAGHVVVCTFNRGMLVMTPGSPHATAAGGPSGCRLDVKEGLDHALYYSDTGHIYRLA